MDPHPDEHTYPGEENLEWGQGIKEEQRVHRPQSKYSAVGEQARKMLSHDSLCKVFCGGKNCKYCSFGNWKEKQMAVNGLYSEWVTCNILAMARMSTENIKQYKMIEQLQNLRVKTVINLQQKGEHAHCGSGNDDSGFSYNPQTVMDAGLFFYNFLIQDYGVTGMSSLLDIVKVMQFAVSLGKVAVHCHAGLGRTGLIIACYLIYNNRVKAAKAIQYVRSRRPGAIQTKQQMMACQQFEEYMRPFFLIFTNDHAVSFNQSLMRQRHLLHGYEARKLNYIPKVVYVCCERLLQLCGKGNALSSLCSTHNSSDIESLSGSLTDRDTFTSDQFNTEETGNDNFRLSRRDSHGESLPRHPSLAQSDALYMQGHGTSIVSDNGKVKLSGGTHRSSDSVVSNDDDDSDDCIVYGQQTRRGLTQVQRLEEESARKAEEKSAEGQTACSNGTPTDVLSADLVWSVILKTDYPAHVSDRLSKLKERLNRTEKAWQDLAREDDLQVLCGIMCDWLDQLNGPVLTGQDVLALTENIVDPDKALFHLERGTKYFLEYILLIICKFAISTEDLQCSVLEFFLSYLCQKRLNMGYLPTCHHHSHFGVLKPEHATHLFQLFVNLLEQENRKLSSGS